MTVTSTTQTQYTSQTQSKSSSVQETPKNDQQSRYEMLLKKGDSMSEAEWKELHYYSAMRPLKCLDEAGNAALNKALEGKTDAEKFSIKSVIELEFMTSVKLNAQGGLDRKKFDSIDTSKSATVDRFEKFMEDFHKSGSIDKIGLMDVMDKFLNIYKASDPSTDVKNQENSVVDKFLEDLYSKGSTATASAITKESIQNKVNEYAQALMESRGDTPKSESDISKMLNDYKKELLSDYKKSLDSATNDTMTLEQQAIIKVLLEENTQEASSLEKLLATTEVNKTQTTSETEESSQQKNINVDDVKVDTLDERANEILNGLLVGMSDKDKGAIKLYLSFSMSIKSESVIDGKLHIEHEHKTDRESILEKLDKLSNKNKERSGDLADEISRVVNELKRLYVNDTTTEDLK